MEFHLFRTGQTLSAIALFSLLLSSPSAARPQTPAAGCKAESALQMEEVFGLIKNNVPEFLVEQIVSCHVSFSLDPAVLERLAGSGAPKPVIDALDRDTVSRMTVEQAHRDVAALDDRKRANEASVNAERDAALQKLETDFQAQRRKASAIPPKDQFETTAAYNERAAKANDALAAMDQNHQADLSRLRDDFQAALAQRNAILDHRIAFLQNSLYPLASIQPKYVSYDADEARLAVGVGDSEFWFNVLPSRAKDMYEHWSTVRLMQPYADGEAVTRYLADNSGLDPVSGIPRIQALLDIARTALDRRDYIRAKDYFGRVLNLDPANPAAKGGLAAIETATAPPPSPSIARPPLPEPAPSTGATPNHIGQVDISQFAGLHPGDSLDRAFILFGKPEKDGGAFLYYGDGQTIQLSVLVDRRAEARITGAVVYSRNIDWLRSRVPSDPLLDLIGQSLSSLAILPAPSTVPRVNTEGSYSWRLPSGGDLSIQVSNGVISLVALNWARSYPPPAPAPTTQPAAWLYSRNIVVTRANPTAERAGTIIATRRGTQNYNVYYIDATDFTGGGTLDIEIQIASTSQTDGSFDLFPANAPIPTGNHATGSLVGRYDVPKGTTTRMEYRFRSGMKFALGLEGNWFSPMGARGVVQIHVTVRR